MSLLDLNDANQRLTRLYDAVHVRGSHETVTSRFWMAIFQEFYRFRPGIYSAAEQAPMPDGRRRIDAVLYDVEGRVYPHIYVEFKPNDRPQRMEEEDQEQVTNYCLELLAANPNRRAIRAMLCYGTRASFWTVKRHGPSSRDRQDFIDADQDDGQHLYDLLNSIKPILL